MPVKFGIVLIVPLVIFAVLWAVQRQTPTEPSEFESFPHVHSVESNNVDNPTHRIIHILNWHFVDRDDFAIDIQDQTSKTLTDDEIDAHYEDFLKDVESIQKEQVDVLRHLVNQYGIKSVFVEGVTDENVKA